MTEDDLTFHHLEIGEDIEQNLELMRMVFGQTSGVDTFVKNLLDYHPTMSLRDFFTIKHHGKMVASLNLIPVKWSIDAVPLKVAAMGCVATHPEHRRRGLQRRLANEFHKRAAEQEYDLCAIEGIPYFYRQFGYEYALPLNEETRISLNQIPDYELKLEFRPFTEKDIPKAMQLLTQSQRKFYVHSVRDEQIWRLQQTGMASGDKFEGYAIEKDGEMVGYIRISDGPEAKELILREAPDVDRSTREAILVFAKDIGVRRGFETLVARVSYYDLLTEQLIVLGAVKRVPPYAWQIRVVDHVKFFRKMKPIFEKRLTTSAYHHLSETLNFNFYRFMVQIVIEGGIIRDIHRLDSSEDRTIRFNPQVFTQLLIGHRSREELENTYPDFIIRPSHKQVIDVLFPKLPSHIHSAY